MKTAAATLLALLACAPVAAQAQRTPSADTLRAPPLLRNESKSPRTVEVTLTAAPGRLSLLPGVETEVFAYNGTVPGPTLEVHEGDRVIIHLRNELPAETTVHWHGLHLPWHMDGSPFHPIPSGGQADFEFTIPPGTAGTYWYHPHPHMGTANQLAMGLYGAIIVRATDDPLPPMTEKLLILNDNRFHDDGSVDLADPQSMQGRLDFENGREGNVLFVNGQILPTVRLRPGEVQRWRIVNASASRVYRLSIPGHELLHVGSDGGLFERPVPTNDVLIANSERLEVLVRGTAEPGTTTHLQDLPYDRYIPQTRPSNWNVPRDLVAVEYTDDPSPSIDVPAALQPVEWLDTANVAATRVFALTQGFINNRAMDMTRVDEVAALGTTEIWQIENLVGMDHPFHLHGFRFQVLDRNGVREPYASWKDTVNVPKHEVVRVVVRFEDYAGKWMFHCHILDHEQNGMMGILEVR